MADLVQARESYWAGEHLVPAGAVMPADDPRVRAAHVEAFDPDPQRAAAEAAAQAEQKPAARTRRS